MSKAKSKTRFKLIAPPASKPEPSSRDFYDRLRESTTAEKAVAVLNKRHFVITVGTAAHVVVGEERFDRGEGLRLFPFAEFRKRYLPYGFEYKANGHTKWLDVGSIYVRHPDRRHFDGQLVFRPTGSPFHFNEHDDYNLWRGLATKEKRGDWSLLQAHIRENLCRGNEEHYVYLLNWMALLVQQPGRLPGVAICLHGGEGTGKTAFYEYLAALFHREHVQHITKRDHLVGRFNAHLSAKVLALADEATFAGDKQILGELKAIITEPERTVERKGIDATTEENCLHLIMASNNEWFLHAAQDARRYFVLNVSDAHAQDTVYFDAITAQQRAGGREAMLYDLQHRDLSRFNPRHVPRTDALREQIDRSREPHETWWKERLTEAMPGTWQERQVKKELYRAYAEWMDQMRATRRLPPELLSKYFVRLYGKDVVAPHRVRVAHHQQWAYTFPPLTEARARFDPHEEWPEPTLLWRKRKRP